jgi:hypothetical protein
MITTNIKDAGRRKEIARLLKPGNLQLGRDIFA